MQNLGRGWCNAYIKCGYDVAGVETTKLSRVGRFSFFHGVRASAAVVPKFNWTMAEIYGMFGVVGLYLIVRSRDIVAFYANFMFSMRVLVVL